MQMANPNDKVISIHYVLILLELLKSKGLSPNDVLTGSHILEAQFKDHEASISFSQFNRVIENALTISQLPELGLQFGKQLNLTAHGDMGIAMMSSETIQQALETGVQYLAIRNPLIHLSYHLEKNRVSLQVMLDFATGAVKRFLLDMTMASIHCIRTFLLGDAAGPFEVSFNYPRPEKIKPYEAFFHHQLNFDATSSAYSFPQTELQIKLPLADPLTREIAEKRCKIKLSALSTHQDLSSKVKQLLLSRPGYFPNLDEIAAKLFVSPRTLRRHLSEENTSFQEIVNALRQELAEDYLRSTSLSISEISDLLNYSDPSNFANAFKKRGSLSPLQFREQFSRKK
jgi:AraC-like DNA-binding protein